MKKYLLLSLLLIFICSGKIFPQQHSGSERRAVSLTERIRSLESKAAGGDSAAMYHLSTLFRNGFDSIPADSVKSRKLLRAAAAAGYPPAMNLLGTEFISSSSEHNRDSALYYLRKAAGAGDLKAHNNLAFLLLEDSIANDDALREAKSHLEVAASGGLTHAVASLADLYRTGRGTSPDTLKASVLYLQAVSAGLQDAELKLLLMNRERYSRLRGVTALREGLEAAHAGAQTVAFNLYSIAARDSLPQALALLADACAGAKGTDYNHPEAMRLFLAAARAGDPSAAFILAETLEIFPDALSVISDDSRKAETPEYWYSRAREAGITDARAALLRLFTFPKGIE